MMSNKDLRKLFDKISENYIKNDYQIQKVNENINYLLDKSNFVDMDINQKIKDTYNDTYFVNSRNNKIWLVSNHKRLDKKLINCLINRIISFKRYSGNDIENKIYIWLTDIKKQFPKKRNIILGIKNVNSASCEVYPPDVKINGNIYIWRKEEVAKVLIHELLHSLRYDYYSQNNELDSMIKKKFNINNHININESYTETLATILNCIYFTLENNRSFEYFIALLLNEIEHSNRQVKKILYHYSYHDIGELFRKNSNKIFKQNTSVFSYYILKNMLLNNVLEFVKFIIQNKLKYPKNGNKKYYKLLINSNQNMIYNNKNIDRDLNLRMTIT